MPCRFVGVGVPFFVFCVFFCVFFLPASYATQPSHATQVKPFHRKKILQACEAMRNAKSAPPSLALVPRKVPSPDRELAHRLEEAKEREARAERERMEHEEVLARLRAQERERAERELAEAEERRKEERRLGEVERMRIEAEESAKAEAQRRKADAELREKRRIAAEVAMRRREIFSYC